MESSQHGKLAIFYSFIIFQKLFFLCFFKRQTRKEFCILCLATTLPRTRLFSKWHSWENRFKLDSYNSVSVILHELIQYCNIIMCALFILVTAPM